MKCWSLAAVVFLPLSVTATAAATAPAKQFEGVAVLLTATGCGTDWAVGDTSVVRYTPSGLTGNPTNTRLTFHNQNFAQAYTTTTGRFTTTLQNVSTMFIGAGFGPDDNQATLAQTSPLPTSTTDTTIFINMAGKITQFGDTAGCTVTFRAGLALKP